MTVVRHCEAAPDPPLATIVPRVHAVRRQLPGVDRIVATDVYASSPFIFTSNRSGGDLASALFTSYNSDLLIFTRQRS